MRSVTGEEELRPPLLREVGRRPSAVVRVGRGSRPGMPLLARGADMLAAGGEFFERRVELTIALLRKTPLFSACGLLFVPSLSWSFDRD